MSLAHHRNWKFEIMKSLVWLWYSVLQFVENGITKNEHFACRSTSVHPEDMLVTASSCKSEMEAIKNGMLGCQVTDASQLTIWYSLASASYTRPITTVARNVNAGWHKTLKPWSTGENKCYIGSLDAHYTTKRRQLLSSFCIGVVFVCRGPHDVWSKSLDCTTKSEISFCYGGDAEEI